MLFDNRVRSKQKLKLPGSSSIVSIFDSVEKEPEWPMVLSYRKKINKRSLFWVKTCSGIGGKRKVR